LTEVEKERYRVLFNCIQPNGTGFGTGTGTIDTFGFDMHNQTNAFFDLDVNLDLQLNAIDTIVDATPNANTNANTMHQQYIMDTPTFQLSTEFDIDT